MKKLFDEFMARKWFWDLDIKELIILIVITGIMVSVFIRSWDLYNKDSAAFWTSAYYSIVFGI